MMMVMGHSRRRLAAVSLGMISIFWAGASSATAQAPAVPAVVQGEPIRNAPDGNKGVVEPLMQTWRPCGWKDNINKIIRTYTRARGSSKGKVLPKGTATLTCGNKNFGYHHMMDRHMTQWKNDAWLTGENWRDTADYAMEWALKDPDKVTYRADNDSFCYSRLIYLVNKKTKKVVGTRIPNVVVTHKSHNVVTAIPKNTQCS